MSLTTPACRPEARIIQGVRAGPSLAQTRGLLGCLVILLALGCSRQATLIELSGSTMGTYYSVKIARPPSGITPESLAPRLEQLLAAVNAEISTYDPQSELSRLNANPSTDWIEVSPNLYAAIAEGQRLAALTEGTFDITVGPLVNLWGFGPERRSSQPPTEAEIQAARARVGYRKLELRSDPPAVRKARGDLYLDLSALGEGYGVERIAAWLESQGIQDYLVAIAGTIRAKGLNAQGRPWGIAIEEPLPDRRAVHRIIPLSNLAVSTSGDYRNFFDYEGRRYGHEIDPITGAPMAGRLASVSVLGDNAMAIDGLATALMVLGEERGCKFAEDQGIAAYFILRTEPGLKTIATSAFRGYLQGASGSP